MEDKCTGCLSLGRKLYFIGNTDYYYIYSEIMNEIPVLSVADLCVRLCWECRGHLRTFHHFKQRAVRSLTDLVQNTTLNSTSTITYQLQHNISYPDTTILPLVDPPNSLVKGADMGETYVKRDLLRETLVKGGLLGEIEVKCEDWTEHCEPEGFADTLSPEPLVVDEDDKPLKTKKKSPKLKSIKVIKVKKKRKKKTDAINKDAPIDNDTIDVEPIDNIDYDSRDNTEAVEEQNCDKLESIENELKKPKDLINEEIKPKVDKKVPITLSKDGSGRPQCQECGKVFSSKKTYRYHLNVLHKGQNRYPCPRCGKVYQWKSNLGRHMRSHKAVDDGELFCSVCDKSFASVATFRQHLRLSRSHVPEADFSFACDSCGKRFVNKTRLRDHIDWEHLHRVKFRCTLCDKPFKCHTSLYVHTQNVHAARDRRDNLCHVCGKSYQNAAKLKYHITAMHSGETPYRCSHAHCRAAFGWYSSLYRHVREVHYKMKGVGKKTKKIKASEEPQYVPL